MTTPSDLPVVLQTAGPVVARYGYWAVAVLVMVEDFGVPLPGETTLLAAAFFASIGQLNIIAIFFVALLAAIIGDSIGFVIGGYGGRPLMERFGKYVFLPPKRLAKAEGYFNSHGGKIVVIARFIEGLRQFNGILAGISEMSWRRFVMFNSIGAALWVGFWSSVGYFGGHYVVKFERFDLILTIIIVVGLAGYGLTHLLRRQSTKEPR